MHRILNIIKHLTARAMDSVAVLAVKLGALGGAYFLYVEGRDWRADVWRDGRAVMAQLGGFEAVIDLR